MNKRQKEVERQLLENEQEILSKLELNYTRALADIKKNIKSLMVDLTQSKVYQIEYQMMLEQQLSGALDVLHSTNFTSIAQYMQKCYEDGFMGSFYDIMGQGIPLVLPLNQEQLIKAVSKTGDDYKLSNKLGVSTKELKKQVQAEISRGFAMEMSYQEIARNISNYGQASFNRAALIAQTEGHRIQNEAKMDAMGAAKGHGADIVKQWDSTMDGKTRKSHKELDGQIRELDEPFEIGGRSGMYPGGFGAPSEDCRCRCAVLQRARWALDEDELETLKERAAYFGLDKTNDFADFKVKYLKNAGKNGTLIKNLDLDDMQLFAEGENINTDVIKEIYDVIHRGELSGQYYISNVLIKSIPPDEKGGKPLLQIEPIPMGNFPMLQLNINSDLLAGRTLDEINKIIADSKYSLTSNLKEAAIHETGHAKLINGKSICEIIELYAELADKGLEDISKIAFEDGVEAIAEIEVLKARGSILTKESKELYDKYMGGKK
ncbi:MAG: phage minor head protein [Clostridiales bacterium]